MTDNPDADAARALIACLDLTNLNDDCTEADIAALCKRAETPQGRVAAICIWPRFVALARSLAAPELRIATVVNFPHGSDDPARTAGDAASALADGADEIDMVIDYRRLADTQGHVERQVGTVKQAVGPTLLKAILETGELATPELIARASQEALAGGADFLKTSTGKTARHASLDAATIMLEAIAAHGGSVGFKASGGIRAFEEARAYRDLADSVCGAGWAGPARFRIGASSVLGDLLAVAAGTARATHKATY
ncbi:MAG: deoxyribose-phosphate aldolase [Aurantimonas endophytica]|uniref:Deoxyribose-phosphate aldolase n=1 Tax=Aurantimonas endophytica TaxID=1522175 RepID=A0A7W6HCF7_9HYPH|nr:deoxyribose-phosphate aldolase [Aurantimonas endophytica]MBB4002669.1 deoxyribose-phosphate aldolase [Aurantimonas endophytica]MCO6403549.1 deoxyribose-phosphate aldolase [Aurantimonas endophytica]